MDNFRDKGLSGGARAHAGGGVTVNEQDCIMDLTSLERGRGGQAAQALAPGVMSNFRPDQPTLGETTMLSSYQLLRPCFPWPRKTIAVLVILLVFILVLVALGATPLTAIGAVVITAVVAITGDAPGTVPGL
jgi:hypothetical protein